MADRTLNGLRGCMSSLDMTIGPCVAQASDTLAREQVALMTKYLDFVSKRVNLIGDRVRFELRLYLAMGSGAAEAMQRLGSGAPELTRLCGQATALLASAEARQVQLEAVSSALRTELSRIVRGLPEGHPGLRKEVEGIVVACSRPIIGFQRAWFAPQAWESSPDLLPDVEVLLASAASAPKQHALNGDKSS
ncbi:hypothetical protein [Variovorax sp. GT1P44]|uniref:hypothetical protein n=1 Tax=Variovorax sp. GT1P44 TaxID=3443742 RepID=UPI003F489D70